MFQYILIFKEDFNSAFCLVFEPKLQGGYFKKNLEYDILTIQMP